VIIQLLGIVENGAVASSLLPANNRTPISMPKGTDLFVNMDLYKRSGQRASLITGSPVLLLTVRKKFTDLKFVIRKQGTITNAPMGQVQFVIAHADTKDPSFEPGLYSYDIWLTQAGFRDAVMPISAFYLTPADAGIP
jgi:hypothetical protein